MKTSSRLRVAVIGLGWWGQTVVRYLHQARNIEVLCAADLNTELATRFTQAEGIALAPSFEAVLADPRIEGVVLCTPHSLHTEQIVAAAQAGKHVFCEKPLTLTRADALRAVAAVNQHGRVLAVGHERRFEAPIQRAMAMIHSGELGKPLQMEANFSQDKFLGMDPNNWPCLPQKRRRAR